MKPSGQEPSGTFPFLGRSALLSGLFAVEAAVSFVVDIVVAAAFGLSMSSDALYAAWMLPKTFGRGTFSGLTNAFMGLFSDREDRTAAYNQALTVIAVVALPLAAIFSVTGSWWLPLTIPGAAVETKLAAVPLAAVLAWLIGFLALAETFRAIYYQEDQLWLPALARAFGGIVSATLIWFAARERNLLWAAWGITAGAGLEALTSFLGLAWLLRMRFRPQWPTRSTMQEMVSLVGASLAGPGLQALAGVGERGLASLLPVGSIAAVSYAHRIVVTLTKLIFRGFVITTIQTQPSEIKARLRTRSRLIVLVAIPISIVLAVLAMPFVGVVFGRKGFTSQDVQTLGLVLQVYAPAVLVMALSRIPFGLAYAQKQGSTVLFLFLVTSATRVLSVALFVSLGLGLRAFGLGYSLAMGLGLVWLYFSVLHQEREVVLTRIDVVQLVLVGLSAWMGAGLLASLVEHWVIAWRWADWFELTAGVIGCGAFFFASLWALKMDEARQLLRMARGRRP